MNPTACCQILTRMWERRDNEKIVKSNVISLWLGLRVNKTHRIVCGWSRCAFLCSQCCCISNLWRLEGEMQSDPERGWEPCSIYNARCTRLSSWINLTGMNASHWDYNMGANGRVMSALPSHRGRIHQQLPASRKLIDSTTSGGYHRVLYYNIFSEF